MVHSTTSELNELKLFADSRGGFEAYHSKFVELCKHLEENGAPLSEAMKKLYFHDGIKDPDYKEAIVVTQPARIDFETMVEDIRL